MSMSARAVVNSSSAGSRTHGCWRTHRRTAPTPSWTAPATFLWRSTASPAHDTGAVQRGPSRSTSSPTRPPARHPGHDRTKRQHRALDRVRPPRPQTIKTIRQAGRSFVAWTALQLTECSHPSCGITSSPSSTRASLSSAAARRCHDHHESGTREGPARKPSTFCSAIPYAAEPHPQAAIVVLRRASARSKRQHHTVT
jgi:hypothetical protein